VLWEIDKQVKSSICDNVLRLSLNLQRTTTYILTWQAEAGRISQLSLTGVVNTGRYTVHVAFVLIYLL